MREFTELDVRTMLGLPTADDHNDGHRVTVTVDYKGDDFEHSICCYPANCDHPAAVHIDWDEPVTDLDTDGIIGLREEQSAFSWEHAIEFIPEILKDAYEGPEDDQVIRVVVNGYYLRYALAVQAAA